MSRTLRPRRRKHDEDDDDESNVRISNEHIVRLDRKTLADLPYLKCIELVKLLPHQFDLDKWRTTFTLSNSWMKKIYKNDVYHDTDLPPSPTETVTPRQKKIMNDYITKRFKQSNQIFTSSKTRRQPPLDSLIECLAKPFKVDIKSNSSLTEQDLEARRQHKQGQPLCSLNSDNIAVCARHKVQPEEVIVRIALEKMKILSVEEELRYQQLLKDQDFMRELNGCVERYLNGDGESHGLSNEQQQQEQHNKTYVDPT